MFVRSIQQPVGKCDHKSVGRAADSHAGDDEEGVGHARAQ